MSWQRAKKIHFIGIGGIGVSAIARMMLAHGKTVTGSDLNSSETTEELEKLGAKVYLGHNKKNLESETDLVIYSPAIPGNNPELKRALELQVTGYKLRVTSYPEFLGQLSKEKFTIAISGTNGKSTTTAILGLILEKAGLDPLVIVGAKVPEWKGNLRLSAENRSPLFVVEACEWRAHMLNLSPKIIVLTNLEADHLDYYRDLNHIIKTFQVYIEKLPKDGILVLNNDDANLKKLKPRTTGAVVRGKPKCRVITYGTKNQADVMAKNIVVKPGYQEFECGTPGSTQIKVPGLFNIYNVLAAAATALVLGIRPEIIKESIENFSGLWRRFELVDADKRGYLRGFTPKITLISDYAHHPTAVEGTIQAAREFYPDRRIVAVFQPHQRSRTKKLFNEFVKSFDRADLTIISEIYDVAGREAREDQDISSKDLVVAIQKRRQEIYPHTRTSFGVGVYYAPNLAETKKIILENIQPDDLVLIMGAGDIYALNLKG